MFQFHSGSTKQINFSLKYLSKVWSPMFQFHLWLAKQNNSSMLATITASAVVSIPLWSTKQINLMWTTYTTFSSIKSFHSTLLD